MAPILGGNHVRSARRSKLGVCNEVAFGLNLLNLEGVNTVYKADFRGLL